MPQCISPASKSGVTSFICSLKLSSDVRSIVRWNLFVSFFLLLADRAHASNQINTYDASCRNRIPHEKLSNKILRVQRGRFNSVARVSNSNCCERDRMSRTNDFLEHTGLLTRRADTLRQSFERLMLSTRNYWNENNFSNIKIEKLIYSEI